MNPSESAQAAHTAERVTRSRWPGLGAAMTAAVGAHPTTSDPCVTGTVGTVENSRIRRCSGYLPKWRELCLVCLVSRKSVSSRPFPAQWPPTHAPAGSARTVCRKFGLIPHAVPLGKQTISCGVLWPVSMRGWMRPARMTSLGCVGSRIDCWAPPAVARSNPPSGGTWTVASLSCGADRSGSSTVNSSTRVLLPSVRSTRHAWNPFPCWRLTFHRSGRYP